MKFEFYYKFNYKITGETFFNYYKIISLLLFLQQAYIGITFLARKHFVYFWRLKKVNVLDFQRACGYVRSKENFPVVAKVSVWAERK